MESINMMKLFITTNAILWLFLSLVTIIMGNAKLLEKRGYSESYISFMRKNYKSRSILMALVIPALQVASYFISTLFIEDPSSRIDIVGLIFIILVIPFPIIDNLSTRRNLKPVKENSDVTMVIDFKHKVLHLVYNPILEIILTVTTVCYTVFVVKPVELFYLHIILPWIFYLMARGSQRTIKPHLKDAYLWAFIFITLNFGLVIYYLLNSLGLDSGSLGEVWQTVGYTLVIVMTARIILYLTNYPRLSKELAGR